MRQSFILTLSVMERAKQASRSIGRFQRGRSGSIAVEGAMFLSLICFGAMQLISIKSTSDMRSRMGDALHVSAQYISQGGTDLSRLETLFTQNYGSTPDSIDTSIICAAPPVTLNDGSLDTDKETVEAYAVYGTVKKPNAQKPNGDWANCSETHPYRFLDLKVSDEAPKMLNEKSELMTSRLRIRI